MCAHTHTSPSAPPDPLVSPASWPGPLVPPAAGSSCGCSLRDLLPDSRPHYLLIISSSGTFPSTHTHLHTCTHSSRWHHGHMDHSDSGKQLGMGFGEKPGNTVLIRYRAWPSRCTDQPLLAHNRLLYPLIPLFPTCSSPNHLDPSLSPPLVHP